MRLWPFSGKQKSPELVINKNFFMAVFTTETTLPTILQVINPDGTNGAVQGFGAPLMENASRDLLNTPISSGDYALATKDRTTVIRLVVRAKGEDPTPDTAALTQAEAEYYGLDTESFQYLKRCERFMVLHFAGYSPKVFDSIRFLFDLISRLALLTQGLIYDPLAECYRKPSELDRNSNVQESVDALNLCKIKTVRGAQGIWCSTRGLSKLNLPEFEMYDVPQELTDVAALMLILAAETVLMGTKMKPGETAFAPDSPLRIVAGTKNRDDWGDRPTLEFRGSNGSIADGILAWQRSQEPA